MTDRSRRDFLKNSGSALGVSWLAARWPLVLAASQAACESREHGAAFTSLSVAQARGLEAAAEQIFPGGDTPGAKEAGVIHFIDQALQTFMSGASVPLREGLAQLDTAAGGEFAVQPATRQVELLKQIESTPFFGTLRFLTLVGLFSMPGYGGNRDHAGWRAIGFDHRHGWQPPFGFYDKQAGKTGGGDGY